MGWKSEMKKRREKNSKKQIHTRLAIGIPSTGLMHIDTAQRLAGLMFVLGHMRTITPMVIKTEGIGVAEARNDIVRVAQDQQMDQLLFIDTDMTFPPNVYEVLSGHLKNGYLQDEGYGRGSVPIEVVGCNYSRRDGTGISVAMGMDGKRLSSEKKGLIEVKGMGAGMLLIDMKVFETIDKPYFCDLTLTEKVDNPNPMSRILSEDFFFCNQVRSKGTEVYCDTDLSMEIGHVGSTIFGLKKIEIAEPTQ